MNTSKNDEYSMKTLLDYLDNDLRLISIGCNPSPLSVKHQCYFANPRNRFWKAMSGSGLIDEEIKANAQSMQRLLQQYRIGFTDVVKRCTPSVSNLNAADYREESPQLLEKLIKYQPEVCWFHGKVAYKNFLKFAFKKNDDLEWGLQRHTIGKSKIFVTPNPSSANAVYSLNDLIDWYRKLKDLLPSESE